MAGCRCPDCRGANNAYQLRWRRLARRPDRVRLPASLPAGAVRAHIAELRATGMALREIARQAEVGPSTIVDIVKGRTCRPATRARILAVVPAPPPRSESHESLGYAGEALDVLEPLRLLVEPRELAWKEHAECRRLSLTQADMVRVFFPTRGQPVELGRRICARCPVCAECLEFALATRAHGVWGGTSGQQRDDILKDRREAARA